MLIEQVGFGDPEALAVNLEEFSVGYFQGGCDVVDVGVENVAAALQRVGKAVQRMDVPRLDCCEKLSIRHELFYPRKTDYWPCLCGACLECLEAASRP